MSRKLDGPEHNGYHQARVAQQIVGVAMGLAAVAATFVSEGSNWRALALALASGLFLQVPGMTAIIKNILNRVKPHG